MEQRLGGLGGLLVLLKYPEVELQTRILIRGQRLFRFAWYEQEKHTVLP